MIDIKYFVRTMEGRPNILPDYFEKIIDTKHLYVKSYIDALYKISDYNAVLVEDDILLCKNFKKEIEKVIKQYPNSIINFFSNPDVFYTTHYSECFNYNQCTYFPKGLAKELADDIMKIYVPETPGNYTQRYGRLLHITLELNGIPHVVHRPCLVQHIDGKSTYNGTYYNRNTIYYKDYIDELGIDYIDAYKPENRKKLRELLDRDRKEWNTKYKGLSN